MDRLSILIVHHNRIRYLKATLASILEKTVYPFELLIYDNRSEHKDRRFLKKFEERAKVPVKVFYGSSNIGVWRASNILIAHASSRGTLGFIKMDNDCIVRTKGWETKWMKVAEDIPEVGVVAANAERISVRNSHIRRWDVKGHRLLVNHDYGTGVCVYVPGRTFRQIGYYEEIFGLVGHADKSLEVRCRCIDKLFVYDRDVVVDRQRPGRKDRYGGYRSWKNRYVKNNRPLFWKVKEEYLAGKRSPAVWYEKYPCPDGVRYSNPASLVNLETGKWNG